MIPDTLFFLAHIAYFLVVCYRTWEWAYMDELYLTKFTDYVFWHGRMGVVTASMMAWSVVVGFWYTIYKWIEA